MSEQPVEYLVERSARNASPMWSRTVVLHRTVRLSEAVVSALRWAEKTGMSVRVRRSGHLWRTSRECEAWPGGSLNWVSADAVHALLTAAAGRLT